MEQKLLLSKKEEDTILAKRWWKSRDDLFKFLLVATVFGLWSNERPNNLEDEKLVILHKS